MASRKKVSRFKGWWNLPVTVNELEFQMSELSDQVAQLPEAIAGAQNRVSEKLKALQDALDAERGIADALATSEVAEDVAQNQELTDARAAVDAKVEEANSAVAVISESIASLNQVAQNDPEASPVEDAPVNPADGEVTP